MWALVESGSISKIYIQPKAITIGDTKYPSNIFTVWSETELKAIGIYIVIIDNTNYKDPEYYINTDQSFTFADDKVTASYGSATAQDLDTLKTTHKLKISNQAYGLLQPNDWLVVRNQEAGTAIPSNCR
jgi:hypothetical protein